MQRLREISVETVTTAPKVQRIERLQTLEKEHKDALERAVSLNIPHAVATPEGRPPSREDDKEGSSSRGKDTAEPCEQASGDSSRTELKATGGRTNWNEVVEKLYERTESGNLVRKDVVTQ